jgi:hypothetical protein
LRPSDRELPEQRSGAFRHKNTHGYNLHEHDKSMKMKNTLKACLNSIFILKNVDTARKQHILGTKDI